MKFKVKSSVKFNGKLYRTSEDITVSRDKDLEELQTIGVLGDVIEPKIEVSENIVPENDTEKVIVDDNEIPIKPKKVKGKSNKTK